MKSYFNVCFEAEIQKYPTRESIIQLWKDLAKRRYDKRHNGKSASALQKDTQIFVAGNTFQKNLYKILPNFDAVAARYGLRAKWLGRSSLLLDTRNNDKIVATSQCSVKKRGRKTTSYQDQGPPTPNINLEPNINLDISNQGPNNQAGDSNAKPTIKFSNYIPNVIYNVDKNSEDHQLIVNKSKRKLPYEEGIMSFAKNKGPGSATAQKGALQVAQQLTQKDNNVIVIDSASESEESDNSVNHQSESYQPKGHQADGPQFEDHQSEKPAKKAKLIQTSTHPLPHPLTQPAEPSTQPSQSSMQPSLQTLIQPLTEPVTEPFKGPLTQLNTSNFNYYKPTIFFNKLPLPQPPPPTITSDPQTSNTHPGQPVTLNNLNKDKDKGPSQNLSINTPFEPTYWSQLFKAFGGPNITNQIQPTLHPEVSNNEASQHPEVRNTQPPPPREVRNNVNPERGCVGSYFNSGNTGLGSMFTQTKKPTQSEKTTIQIQAKNKIDTEDPYFSTGNTALGDFFNRKT